jgi:hypothetical protein
MKSKNVLRYFATPAAVFSTLVVFLLLILLVQGIFYGLLPEFITEKVVKQPGGVEDPNWRLVHGKKEFLPNGTIHLVLTVGYGKAGEQYNQEQIYDANNLLLWKGLHKDRPYNYLTWAQYPKEAIGSRWILELGMINPTFSRSLEIPVSTQDQVKEAWRYDSCSEVFTGYEIKGSRIGYMGARGFAESKSDAVPLGKFELCWNWFAQNSLNPLVLWQTNRRIYEINFQERTITSLFETADANIIDLRMKNWEHSGDAKLDSDEQYRSLICFKTDRDGQYHLLLRQPQEQLKVAGADYRKGAEFTATRNGVYMCQQTSDSNPPAPGESIEIRQKYWSEYFKRPHMNGVELYRVKDDGSLLLLSKFDWIMPARRIAAREDLQTQLRRYLSIVSPPAYRMAWRWGTESRLHPPLVDDNVVAGAFWEIVQWWHPINRIANWVVSVLLMCLVLWHGWARRTSWASLVFWVIFAGLFNLAGFLTYWALNHTPVIKCPVCGRYRGIGRTDCVRCGAELPKPKPQKLDLILTP